MDDDVGEVARRVAKRLAEVDPASLKRWLAIGQGIVASYESSDLDNSADLLQALLQIATSETSFDA